MHIGIYKVRNNVNAVVHNHSIYASAMAVSNHAIPPIMDDQMAIIGGEIKVAQYAQSGSEELACNVVDVLEDRMRLYFKITAP